MKNICNIISNFFYRLRTNRKLYRKFKGGITMEPISIIGKALYIDRGIRIGIITDIVIAYAQLCFEIGAIPEGVSPGRYYPVDRLNNGQKDNIYIVW